MENITNDIYYVGVNDNKIDLFEGQYKVPNGMSYNSYLIYDQKIAIMDTVDANFIDEWLANIEVVLKGKKPDYLIIQHMEPDHSSGIIKFLDKYPKTEVVGNAKTFAMIEQFFQKTVSNKITVKDNDILNLGNHVLNFIFAPMVHWPEVMVTYEKNNKILFSADGFGKFGCINSNEEWIDEARRYYIGIVGKYGAQVQNLLKKASQLDINMICPLHGPILSNNLEYYIGLYNIWSSYQSEEDGVLIAYCSVYGNTKEAALFLEKSLKEKGCLKIETIDLARTDLSKAISLAFKYSKLVLASITYNADLFVFMNHFIYGLLERNFQNKKIAIIENGSWSPLVSKKIKEKFANSKLIEFIEPVIKIISSMNYNNKEEINRLADELVK